MLEIDWGADADAVRERFQDLPPGAEDPDALVYPLDMVVRRLREESAFCPGVITASSGRTGDELVLRFVEGGLAAGSVHFSCAFESIGLKTESLSEQAMAIFARAEFQKLIHEISNKYGAPACVSEATMRTGQLTLIGAALFDAGAMGMVQVLFGHDGGYLAGELRYQAPITDGRGI